METTTSLSARFQAIEFKHAVLAGGPDPGGDARSMMMARCRQLAAAADVGNFQVSLKSDTEQLVFLALLTRYGLKPFRYRKQHKTTVMVRLSKQLMDETIMPIFNDVMAALNERISLLIKELAPAITTEPLRLEILDHEHAGELCDDCQRRLAESAALPASRST
jgi:hypothetical protein